MDRYPDDIWTLIYRTCRRCFNLRLRPPPDAHGQSDALGPSGQHEDASELRCTWDEWIEDLRVASDHLVRDHEIAERRYDALGDMIDANGSVVPISVSAVLVTAQRR
jgi:hypothetical protein